MALPGRRDRGFHPTPVVRGFGLVPIRRRLAPPDVDKPLGCAGPELRLTASHSRPALRRRGPPRGKNRPPFAKLASWAVMSPSGVHPGEPGATPGTVLQGRAGIPVTAAPHNPGGEDSRTA